MNFIDQLNQLGLNGRQSKVYLALLQLGSAGAIELAKSTRLKHPTVYDVLDVLKEKGLAVESIVDNRKVYTAGDPSELQAAEDRRQNALDRILPDLKALYLAGEKRPRIRVYDEAPGYLKVHEELLTVKSGEYFYFGSVREMFQLNTEETLREFYRRRIERGIRSNAIRNYNPDECAIDYMQPGEHNLRQVRYLPTLIAGDIAGLYLYDGKIAVLSALKEKYAMIIESEELFRLLKTVWDLLWQICIPPEKTGQYFLINPPATAPDA